MRKEAANTISVWVYRVMCSLGPVAITQVTATIPARIVRAWGPLVQIVQGFPAAALLKITAVLAMMILSMTVLQTVLECGAVAPLVTSRTVQQQTSMTMSTVMALVTIISILLG